MTIWATGSGNGWSLDWGLPWLLLFSFLSEIPVVLVPSRHCAFPTPFLPVLWAGPPMTERRILYTLSFICAVMTVANFHLAFVWCWALWPVTSAGCVLGLVPLLFAAHTGCMVYKATAAHDDESATEIFVNRWQEGVKYANFLAPLLGIWHYWHNKDDIGRMKRLMFLNAWNAEWNCWFLGCYPGLLWGLVYVDQVMGCRRLSQLRGFLPLHIALGFVPALLSVAIFAVHLYAWNPSEVGTAEQQAPVDSSGKSATADDGSS